MTQMGIGKLGDAQIPRKKWRFTLELFQGEDPVLVNGQSKRFVKPNGRPNLLIKEVEIEGVWHPVSNSIEWGELETNIYDLSKDQIEEFCNVFEKHNNKFTKAVIQVLDGCGSLLESWDLNNVETKLDIHDPLYIGDTTDLGITLKYTDVKYECVVKPFRNKELIDGVSN